jgi:type I restriction enzyme, R subunit
MIAPGGSFEKEATLSLDAFPSPKDLWDNYRAWKRLTPDEEAIVQQDYFEDGSDKGPRYYQQDAINSALEAIAKGQKAAFDHVDGLWGNQVYYAPSPILKR